jgi:hypothetical protein
MTDKAIKFWWCVIPANLAATAANLAIMVTIPLGIWRGLSPEQFLAVLVGTSGAVWLATFAYCKMQSA